MTVLSMLATQPHGNAARSAVHVTTLADCERFFDPDVDLVVYARDPAPSLREAARRLAATDYRGASLLVEPGNASISRLIDAVGGEEPLARDLLVLLELVLDVADARVAGLRVAASRGPMCPAFHVDRVLVRGVIAYVGPGSQWLDDADVDRVALRAGRAGDVRRAGALIHEVPTFHLALMKGEAWPGHAGRGLVHRSPPTQAVRVVATVDAVD